MIAGIFHEGSGLGNQLHRYVATRVLTLDKGYSFGMVAPGNFKGASFINIDMGGDLEKGFNNIELVTEVERGTGRVITHPTVPLWQEKTNYYNPEFNFIEDNTIIDGEFQDERYFSHRMNEVAEWLKTECVEPLDDLCVIGFRGGEYYLFPELGLPKSYFEEGIERMKKINPKMKFEVHTDDPKLARQFFPEYPIVQSVEHNWQAVRYAKYAIIANSSFYILPRLLRHHKPEYTREPVTIAPRYWARRNTKEWSRPDNFYRAFQYI